MRNVAPPPSHLLQTTSPEIADDFVTYRVLALQLPVCWVTALLLCLVGGFSTCHLSHLGRGELFHFFSMVYLAFCKLPPEPTLSKICQWISRRPIGHVTSALNPLSPQKTEFFCGYLPQLVHKLSRRWRPRCPRPSCLSLCSSTAPGLWVHNPIALGEAIRNVTQLSASVLPSAPPLGLRVSHKFQATFTITPPTPRLPRGMPATPRQPQRRHGVVSDGKDNHETVVHVLL